MRHLFLMAVGVLALLPFVWMLSTSLSDPYHVFGESLNLIPKGWRWSNYTGALTKVPFGLFFKNSLIVALFVVSGQVLTATMAGYSFARLRFPGRNLLFVLVLSTMMIPVQVILVPQYIIIRAFGWIDHLTALIVPGLATAFGTFLMRQFFVGLPHELEDAAWVDGCSIPRFVFTVAMPLAKHMVVMLAVLAFIASWGNFLGPLIFLNSLDKATVPLGLYRFMGSYSTSWPELMAATVVAVAPTIIAYALAQRQILEGYSMGGVRR